MVKIAVLVSALVWIGVLVLVAMAWVDDRRLEDDERSRGLRLGGRSQRTQQPGTDTGAQKVGDRVIV
jgi:hypothetical protein